MIANGRGKVSPWWPALAVASIFGIAGADAPRADRSGPKAPEIVKQSADEDVDGKPARPPAPKASPGDALDPAKLDAMIDRGLAAGKVAPSPPTTDEEFIRRVYLDVLGTLPTVPSIREFARSKEPNKRAALIDALLEHPDYATNWARYWRDVIAYRSLVEDPKRIDYDGFTKWLAGEIGANKGWDKIATAMITATGNDEENPAATFIVAEEGKPVELAGEVSRVFLGIQIQCAECHDHPSDPWKRQQFHEFAAFFGGVKQRQEPKGEGGRRAYIIAAKGKARYTMPDLKDPAKKIGVSPRFFLGENPTISDQVTAEEKLKLAAGYVTGAENPWFARSFVNRTWYALMGETFYNPIDDLGPTRTANSPEILDALAQQWQAGGYDIRWLFRTLLNTKAYQRQSRSTDSASGRIPFAANCPSRLRADQIFDALVQALNLDPDPAVGAAATGKGAPKGKGNTEAATKAEKVAIKAGNPIDRRRTMVDHAFGVDPSTPNDDVLGTIPQALLLMNGPLVKGATQARPNNMLGQLLMASGDNRAALDALYLKVLARRPSAKEVATCSHFLNTVGDRAEAFEDILWALLNSTEFVSRR